MALEMRIAESQHWGEQICQSLSDAIRKLGFSDRQIPVIKYADARFELSTDPLTQQQALQGVWSTDKNLKQGEIIFQVDGSFYAEFDVVQPHPQDQRWFVEAMTAWGREGSLKTDARLLSMLDA